MLFLKPNVQNNISNFIKVAAWGLLLFVPFIGASHLFDWDEINFAESAREMMITQEYFRVQINFSPFWEKPPLFFWLQVLSYKWFGVNEFAARFPNAICGVLVLITVFYIGQKHFNNRLAWLWVLFITGSITPHLYYKSGIIDPWFNFFIFISIYQLFLAAQAEEKRTLHFLLMGIFNGLAILTKGPVALLVLGLCGFTLWAIKRFKPYFTLWQLLMALITIVGITSIWFMSELIKNGPKVLSDFIAYQIDLFLNPVAGHGQPWYYHPVVIFFGCFPASIFALKAFVHQRKNQTQPQQLFKLVMNIMFWVVLILFSIVKTKIVHYSSLCYVPLTFLAAWYTEEILTTQQPLPKFKPLLVLFIGLILSGAFATLPFIEYYKYDLIPHIKDAFAVGNLEVQGIWNGWEWMIGVLFGILLLIFYMQQYRRNTIAAVYALLIATGIMIPLLVFQLAPKVEQYTQGSAIEFYKSLQQKDCYVETFGFKSYAQYFYAQQKQHTHPERNNKEWLFTQPTDKPVYVVAKITSEKECKSYPFKEIGRKGGFIFYEKINLTDSLSSH